MSVRRQIEDRVRAMYATFASGDPASYRAQFSDEIVWHVPGANPVSGIYRGSAQYFGTMAQRMQPLDEWTFEITRVLVNERARAALVGFRLKGVRKGIGVDTDGFHFVRLDEDYRILEGWGFVSDQDALDRFFSA